MAIVDDFDTTTEDRPIIRSAAEGVLANDTDPGAFITGGSLTTSQGGEIEFDGDGSYVYVPPPGFSGTDTVTYTTSTPASGTLTITVAAAADQPEIRMADNSLTGLVPVGDAQVNTFVDPQLAGHGSIVPLANGGYAISFAAVFDDGSLGTSNLRDIFVRAFAADGTPAGPAVQVDGLEESSSAPQLAALPDGGFVAVWRPDPSAGIAPQMRFFTETGAAVGAATPVPGAGIDGGASLTTLSNGNFAITLSDVGIGVRVQIFEPDGDPLGGPVVLWAGPPDARRFGAISADNDGGFVVAWRLDDGSGSVSISAQRYGADGSLNGPEILVRGPEPAEFVSTPVIRVLSDDSIAVAWTEQHAVASQVHTIHSQVIGPDGSPRGAEFVSGDAYFGSIYGDLPPKVTALAEGYLVSWDSGADPWFLGSGGPSQGPSPGTLPYVGRVFNNAGEAVSGEILFHDFESQTAIGTVRFFGNAIVALPNGGFAIGMNYLNGLQSDPTATRDSIIQIFDASGQRLGNEALLDPNATADDMLAQALAVLANGNLAAVWTEVVRHEIYSRIMQLKEPAAAQEDAALVIPLAIRINETDNSEHLTRVVIDGVPAGSTLTPPAGTTAAFDAGTGLWTITGAIPQLLTITLTPPANFNGNIELTATAFVQDNAGGPEAASTPVVVPIAVANVNDAPVITSKGGGATAAVNVAENTRAVTQVAATDIDSAALTYSIIGGVDAARFTISAVNGSLFFKTAPDFEAPGDNNGDNVYRVIVRVSDGALADTQAIAVRVTNVGGVTINGTSGNDVVSDGVTVPGQPLPTSEEDVIRGNDGNDRLIGFAGNDRLVGGDGNDKVFGWQGEELLFGGAGSDVLRGGGGKDHLDGGAGADTAYYFDRPGPIAVVLKGADLTAVRVNGVVEDLIRAIENIVGGAFADRLTGDAGANQLIGNAGGDVLKGGAGDDLLVGGLGRDVMAGGAGADGFRFVSRAEMGNTAATRDVITDFTPGVDDIDLSAIDANGPATGHRFTFLAVEGEGFNNVRGELRWFQLDAAGSANDKTIVAGDINGDGSADFQIALTGLKALTEADFHL